MEEAWTVLKILKWTADYFQGKGIESGRRDAELLLGDLIGLDRVGLYLNFDRPLVAAELQAYRERVARRAHREPLQYILGRTEFWSLPLRVGPEALIPRPETELLIEEALPRTPFAALVLDVGTGSGAILVALATERPEARLEGVDISPAALELAAQNLAEHKLSERVSLRAGDLFQLDGGPYDLVVSNPPYINSADLSGLMPEVREHEPMLALDGGPDGLACYRALAGQASRLLKPEGWLLVEIGIGQAEAVRELFAAAGLQRLFIRNDYAGIPRVVGGQRM